jgi:hypothetical protein
VLSRGALTPNAVELIPTLGAISPPRRARPRPGPGQEVLNRLESQLTSPPSHLSLEKRTAISGPLSPATSQPPANRIRFWAKMERLELFSESVPERREIFQNLYQNAAAKIWPRLSGVLDSLDLHERWPLFLPCPVPWRCGLETVCTASGESICHSC